MREIYIVPQKHFIPPVDFTFKRYNKFIDSLYDYTLNFDDLKYWDSKIDLNNNTIVNVLHKLSVSISRLEKEGIKPIQIPKDWNDIHNKDLIYGYVDRPNGGMGINLPDTVRKRVLLFHLINMYNKLIKRNKKNKLFYCYVYEGWYRYY